MFDLIFIWRPMIIVPQCSDSLNLKKNFDEKPVKYEKVGSVINLRNRIPLVEMFSNNAIPTEKSRTKISSDFAEDTKNTVDIWH